MISLQAVGATHRRKDIDRFLEYKTQDTKYPAGHINGHERHTNTLDLSEPVYLPILGEERAGEEDGGEDPEEEDGCVRSIFKTGLWTER